jgi:hypothetical protein
MADPTFKEWVRSNYQFSSAMGGSVTTVEADDEE